MFETILQLIKDLDLHHLATIGIMFYLIVRPWKKEVKEEIKSIKEEIQLVNQGLSEQSRRTDRLYEMFIDLIKYSKESK